MVVLVVSSAAPSLRGKLTRWLLQIKAGVYVGTLSARVRSRVWELTCSSFRAQSRGIKSTGWAVLLYSANTEQGFAILSHGDGPATFEDFEGLWLAKTRPKA